MKTRILLWKLHRWIGLACAVPFAVLAVTGLGLLICHATETAAGPRLDRPVTTLAGVDVAISSLRARYGDTTLGLILPAPDPRHAWQASVRERDGENLTVAFDPQSGQIFAPMPAGAAARDILLTIHNGLLLGLGGKVIALLTAIALIMLTISGFAIMRRRWRTLTSVPWHSASPLAGLHKWTGLVVMIFLFLSASSGFLLLGFKTLGEFGRPGRPNAAMARPISDAARAPLRPMLESALNAHPGAELQGIMPGHGAGPVAVMLLVRDAAPWDKSVTVSFDGQSGAMAPARPVPAFMKLMIAAKSLHTGLWDRSVMLGLYLLAATLCVILLVTGPWLWWRRRPMKRHAR
ncbi:PepSY-associated TM helix domain-containing protein [Tsuneonella sp. CC-YZS046]|uniref:PepSY-associated TM helix domain-containing protein n=1 Tax=Tsuneonella sp. CC-YZS046 TaxID=3042152 RepID=UPI002D79CDB0|nr:PepSY-associated TM helix domain-containing protein [Tsuneonella sp. CC-YZS046]WRO66131.1 PepSY-associated TM helix domain-containing protein [Tsuneonella sp. CC-YZS046]